MHAVRKYAEDVRDGKELPGKSDGKEKLRSYLDTKDVPDIDLVIRSGGNHRLSNFSHGRRFIRNLVFRCPMA